MIQLTMDKWVKSNLGKYIDYDKVYGVQCVDLVKHFIKNVLNVEPKSIGNAVEYYRKRYSSKYLVDNFEWISNTPSFIPKKGDICVFKSRSGNGHVSIATGEGTTSYFYSYDQNYPLGKGEPMSRNVHSYKSFYGVLRPKNQENIFPRVYKSTTENLNAYSSYKFDKPVITIKKGTRVELVNDNVGKMKKNGKTYTMGIIRYNTILYYVAVKYLN